MNELSIALAERGGDSAVSTAVAAWLTAGFEELLEAAARSGPR